MKQTPATTQAELLAVTLVTEPSPPAPMMYFVIAAPAPVAERTGVIIQRP